MGNWRNFRDNFRRISRYDIFYFDMEYAVMKPLMRLFTIIVIFGYLVFTATNPQVMAPWTIQKLLMLALLFVTTGMLFEVIYYAIQDFINRIRIGENWEDVRAWEAVKKKRDANNNSRNDK